MISAYLSKLGAAAARTLRMTRRRLDEIAATDAGDSVPTLRDYPLAPRSTERSDGYR
ncbi:MAG TPA: hypothetical protein VKG85_09535 [Actinomycetes bacterium]|nr:hypothetical protein [Actinomycetes bacterium]